MKNLTLLLLSTFYFIFSANSFAQKSISIPQVKNYIIADSLRSIYLNKQSFDTALIYANQALLLVENKLGKNDTLYADMLSEKSYVYGYSGNYSDAIVYLSKEKELREKIQGDSFKSYHEILSNMAYLNFSLGNYDKSLALNIKALDLCEKELGTKNSSYGLYLNNLASLYLVMGNYEKALPLFLESLEIIKTNQGKDNDDYSASISNLAYLYKRMHQYKKALPLFIESSEIYKRTLGENHSVYGMSLNNLAEIYRTMGEYDKALPLFLEAYKIVKKSLGIDHPDYGIVLNNLAGIYELLGNYDKAIPLYEESINIIKRTFGEEHLQYVDVINNYAFFYDKIKNYKKAKPLFEEGINILNSNIIRNFSFLSEKEKEAYFNMVGYNYSAFNSFALKTKDEFNDITAIVYNNTIRNKGILLKSSTAMRATILNSKDTTLISEYQSWISLKKEISSLYSTPIKKRQKDPKTLEERATTLERDLVSHSNDFSKFSKAHSISWKDVQQALKPNEVAIEFIHFRLRKKEWTDTTLYCALIVTADAKQPKMIPLFRKKQLEKIIGKFGGNNYNYINSIYGKNTEVNKQLYSLIWKPMENYLKGVKKIYLSPDGLLHKISFPAIAKDQNIYLCDIYDIEIKLSTGKITDRSKNGFKNINKLSATLFGGITYDTDSTKQKIWKYLEGTKSEIQEIDKILKKRHIHVNYFSNTTATEGEFKLMASNSNILHIATHGFFYPDPKKVEQAIRETQDTKEIEYGEVVFRGGNRGFGVNTFVESKNPLMRSGLVFAGANNVWNKETKNDSIDDGVLTAQEVSNIDMRKTDLVVMSACETGLGDIKGSEGVYGLQRAFKMAGVDFMIMSLWQVPDKETSEFMISFYNKLIKQKDIKQAFYQTQKEMRTKYDPYFWAAFVLIE